MKTIEEKAKRYDEALKEAKKWHKTFVSGQNYPATDIKVSYEWIFPELKESEDEKIRKRIYNYINVTLDDNESVEKEKWLDWLEKQGEQKKQIHFPKFTFDDVLALQCCMETVKKVQEDKELYERLNLIHNKMYDAYRFEKQGEPKILDVGVEYASGVLKECIDKIAPKSVIKEEKVDNQNCVKTSDKIEPKFKVGDVMRTLREVADNITSGLPVVVSIDEEYYHCTNELIAIKDQDAYEYPSRNRKLKSVDKVELKFKIGDWITNGLCTFRITSLDKKYYWSEDDTVGGDIESIDKQYHLWTIQDAKPGDILVDGDENIGVFDKMEDGGHNWFSYFYNYNLSEGLHDVKGTHPAKKEECDKLLEMVTEKGYVWDAENLKLIKTKHQWKNGDVVRLKTDDGRRFMITNNTVIEDPFQREWFISEIRENGISGGYVSTLMLDTEYEFVNNPVDDALKDVDNEFKKLSEETKDVFKEKDEYAMKDLILTWFKHIEQLADDRKTLNGYVMDYQQCLDEIKCLAMNSREFVERHL